VHGDPDPDGEGADEAPPDEAPGEPAPGGDVSAVPVRTATSTAAATAASTAATHPTRGNQTSSYINSPGVDSPVSPRRRTASPRHAPVVNLQVSEASGFPARSRIAVAPPVTVTV
jgi:hypothetical protein